MITYSGVFKICRDVLIVFLAHQFRGTTVTHLLSTCLSQHQLVCGNFCILCVRMLLTVACHLSKCGDCLSLKRTLICVQSFSDCDLTSPSYFRLPKTHLVPCQSMCKADGASFQVVLVLVASKEWGCNFVI